MNLGNEILSTWEIRMRCSNPAHYACARAEWTIGRLRRLCKRNSAFARSIAGDVTFVNHLFKKADDMIFDKPCQALEQFIIVFETADKLINKYKDFKETENDNEITT